MAKHQQPSQTFDVEKLTNNEVEELYKQKDSTF